ncbi:hypothetical protein NFI96_033385, partial [Prochilodus magdalenae]
KQVTTWSPGGSFAIEDCFDHTDREMFREPATSSDSINLEKYTESVTGYISKCINDYGLQTYHNSFQPETMDDCRDAQAAENPGHGFQWFQSASNPLPVPCRNDYRPIVLTPSTIKCFERLVMRHIKDQFPSSLDPQQFAYNLNRSTDDAISTTFHLTTH